MSHSWFCVYVSLPTAAESCLSHQPLCQMGSLQSPQVVSCPAVLLQSPGRWASGQGCPLLISFCHSLWDAAVPRPFSTPADVHVYNSFPATSFATSCPCHLLRLLSPIILPRKTGRRFGSKGSRRGTSHVVPEGAGAGNLRPCARRTGAGQLSRDQKPPCGGRTAGRPHHRARTVFRPRPSPPSFTVTPSKEASRLLHLSCPCACLSVHLGV